MTTVRVHAQMISLGGGIMLAFVALFTSLFMIVRSSPLYSELTHFLLSIIFLTVLFYLADSWSEKLKFEAGKILFSSLLKSPASVPLSEIREIVFVHEGLNLMPGIDSLTFHLEDGREIVFSLGPLWHHHLVEAFFHEIEEGTGKRLLMTQIR